MSVVLQNNNNLVVSKQKPLYVRPSDWLTLEDLNETEEKFVGLYGVFSGDSNYVTVLSQGDYTVDWGDGTIENFNSNVLAEHKFIYNNISNSTLTSDGYKQVIITITPQNNQHITNINFEVGCHGASPAGNIKYSSKPYRMYHYRYIGKKYLIDRYREYNNRLSDDNRMRKWGVEYTQEEIDTINFFNDLIKKSVKLFDFE